MIRKSYLIKLNQKCNKLCSEIKYSILNKENYSVSYLPTKGTSFLGYKRGFFEQFQLQTKGLKESEKIRTNCKSYLEIFRDKEKRVVQINSIKEGKIDCVHQAYYENDTMYLFPFSETGYTYPTYIYASKQTNSFVQEEYMVNKNQIIYEKYDRKKDYVKYESINYVINGKHPVLSNETGVFSFNPFDYKIKSIDSWFDKTRENS
jgi:hypothetical protein